MYDRHEEYTGYLNATVERAFDHLDEHAKLSAHMTRRSWKMGWGKIDLRLDDSRGKAVGSHDMLEGRVHGVRLRLDEVVTERLPPRHKAWETVGEPRLLVIGPYRMCFDLDTNPNGTRLRVAIAYDGPTRGIPRLLGTLFGRSYARWCIRRMVSDAQAALNTESLSSRQRSAPSFHSRDARECGSDTSTPPAGPASTRS
jgi:hypothetical protein